MSNPEEMIKDIRESFVGSESVFCLGSCYHLYKILKHKYPFAYPRINKSCQHIVTMIGYHSYDINGKVSEQTLRDEKFRKMTDAEIDYFENRKVDLNNPSFFIPNWFAEEEVYCHEYMERLAENMGYKLIREE